MPWGGLELEFMLFIFFCLCRKLCVTLAWTCVFMFCVLERTTLCAAGATFVMHAACCICDGTHDPCSTARPPLSPFMLWIFTTKNRIAICDLPCNGRGGATLQAPLAT
jgi:hypothetical protein